jgi:hypothetical protein
MNVLFFYAKRQVKNNSTLDFREIHGFVAEALGFHAV